MTPERYEQIGQLYHLALERKPVERATFLAEACGADESLCREVESLLAAHGQASTFIAQPPNDVAAGWQVAANPPALSQLAHYQMRSLLGKGGMGEVWLAEDTQLHRQVAVKLLPAEFTHDVERVRRFAREAHAVSALNHPNILTIYEIGATEGKHYIVTEYVAGETLRQRITSQQQMPLTDALTVAAQMAEALAAAHEAGIIHRDIKPENVMVRRDGYVKVLDFGLAKLTENRNGEEDKTLIAVASTATGIVMGTPRYMSPEQARGEKVDARTDLFSLGVMLYEMIAGHAPFAGATPSEVMAAILRDDALPLAADAPPELQHMIHRSLQKKRDERYQTAYELLADLKRLQRQLERLDEQQDELLPETKKVAAITSAPPTLIEATQSAVTETVPLATAKPAPRWLLFIQHKRPQLILGILAVLILLTIAGWLYAKHQPALTEKDTILLADFDNQTGDAVFDRTLKQGLAMQLQQSPFLNLFPTAQVQQTLRLMDRSPDERVTVEIAREICERQGLKALIAGSIAPLGSHYVITLEALNAQSGETLARQQVQTASREQVLQALAQAATQLREKLGNSLSSVQSFNQPLDQIKTAKLQALKDATKSREFSSQGRFVEAIPFLKRAVEIDPQFPVALIRLAIQYHVTGQPESAAKYAKQAYLLSDRVIEEEKLERTCWYHILVTGNQNKALEALTMQQQGYPTTAFVNNNLALAHNMGGQSEPAVAEAREMLRLNPNFGPAYRVLSLALLRLNRFAEAKETIRQGQQQKLGGTEYHLRLYHLAFIEGDTTEMQRQVEAMSGNPEEYAALDWQTDTAAFAGQWRRAQEFSRRAIDLAARVEMTEVAARYTTEQALRSAVLGNCQMSKMCVAQGLAFERGRLPLARAALAQVLCGATSQAQMLADELAKRFPEDTLSQEIWLPVIRAALELQRGGSGNGAAQALEQLRNTARYEAAAEFWPQYLRGQAYLKLGQGTAAAAEFQNILDHRGYAPLSLLYPLAQLGLARATQNRKAYDEFQAFWKEADAQLPLLLAARKEAEQK